jgi:hypothetical protein
MPFNPALAGLALRWLGETSAAAALTLLAWSLAQTGATYLLLASTYRALGMERGAIRWGLALLCLLPLFVQQEAVDFRFWEGGSAALLAALNLRLLVHFDRRPALDAKAMIGVATLSAITFFICPPAGLASSLCWVVFAFRTLPLQRVAPFGAFMAVATGAILLPWAMRNVDVLGEFVPIRSNFGLELALANHPAAVYGATPERIFAARLATVHPAASPAARADVREHGEVAYSRKLGGAAADWIRAHPADFVRLWFRHLREFFLPSAWQMHFSGWNGHRAIRATGVSIVQALGLIGLALALYRRTPAYGYVALYIGALALPFAAFQPTARYTWLIWGLLAYPAVALLFALGGQVRVRLMRSAATQPH